MSMVFSALSPFSLLFVLFVVSNGQYVQFALAGSLVMSLVGYGLSLGQDISFYKTEYKIQDMFVASSVSSLTYMTGLALSELLFGLPALGVLAFLVLQFGTSLNDLPLPDFDHLSSMGIDVCDWIFSILTYAAILGMQLKSYRL